MTISYQLAPGSNNNNKVEPALRVLL